MSEKRAMDGLGAAMLIGFSGLMGFNQVVIKVSNGGFGPVFQAGLRSLIGLAVLLAWLAFRGQLKRANPPAPAQTPTHWTRSVHLWGLVSGLLFTAEFVCLYIALDLSSVSRVTIIFNSMPVWLALAGHLLLPGERLNTLRMLGLVLAMGGVVLAVLHRGSDDASLLGDVLALAATLAWAGIALCARLSPLSAVPPIRQLTYQLATSALVLLAISPLFGPLLRAPTALHISGVVFQAVAIASLGYLLWLWLISIYRANAVASFSFLSPVIAAILGWLLLDEVIYPQVWAALALVAVGIVLINRK
ncbi:putative integral membrane protein [Phaeobacter piscinae]|uniref:Integral membrane protein n=1 Tax=Phaeobacter piscinae TaxID=1580596 RepID=A0AAN1GPV9_9RHOB|nr:DMT family transporter [Phaeobacter piscinae]ATG43012.1 putative integral membrane protein [Phaeobacter piscinae]AUQ74837.1 putative integral membrane protein [Phaeobacter piscinae]AUR35330.1 putative integral membrane protein [Phaeobacter piscinae]